MKFPIKIHTALTEFSIDDAVSFKCMTDDEKKKYLGIRSPDYNEKGQLIGVGPYSFGMHRTPLSGDPGILLSFNSSNFFVTIKDFETAKYVKTAIKLHSINSTSILVGFTGENRDSGHSYFNPPEFYGSESISLDELSLIELKRIYVQIRNAKEDPKFGLLAEKYHYAVSSLPISDSNRFLEMSIILEILLLPNNESEISYRFSLRMARLCKKYLKEDIHKSFEFAKEIYNIRSKLVHEGIHKKTSEKLSAIIDLGRRFILLYLQDPSIFELKSLNSLCLE